MENAKEMPIFSYQVSTASNIFVTHTGSSVTMHSLSFSGAVDNRMCCLTESDLLSIVGTDDDDIYEVIGVGEIEENY